MKTGKPHNLDPQQEKLLEEGLLLPVMEMFYSVQGEGYHTGSAAAFLRIGGCDVGCHWCDIKESWDASIHPLTSLEKITDTIASFKATTVVVTGGEPLLYNLDPLCRQLKKMGLQVHLETSGAHPLSGLFDWICLSPKPETHPLPELVQMADELKVVIAQKDDFAWAEENSNLVKNKCILYLQPEWSKYDSITQEIVEYVKQNTKWHISLQAHKFMRIP
jgi:7-carboxy-7-deazaguanine synthase